VNALFSKQCESLGVEDNNAFCLCITDTYNQTQQLAWICWTRKNSVWLRVDHNICIWKMSVQIWVNFPLVTLNQAT
jgi:hypothetical protein